MKTKFTPSSDSNLLGSTIQAVRKNKGITQEELGRRVGLGKSSISKIEKGLTHISAEDAAILLEAMGEQLVLSASGIDESAATKEQKTKFITTGVSWFAEENKITFAKAYQFLLLYKGIDFLESSFRYEQTLPRTVVLQDLSRVCANNAQVRRCGTLHVHARGNGDTCLAGNALPHWRDGRLQRDGAPALARGCLEVAHASSQRRHSQVSPPKGGSGRTRCRTASESCRLRGQPGPWWSHTHCRT